MSKHFELLNMFREIFSQSRKIRIILLGIGAIKVLINRFKKLKISKSGIEEIDKMDGELFEQYLEIFFKKLGYKVKRTRYVGDYGADLIINRDNIKIAVQAKRYKGLVGVKAIQEVVASQGYYDCDKSIVATNSYFTNQAKNLANKNNVSLRDRKKIINKLAKINPKKHMSNIPGPQQSNKCKICGKLISDKVYRYCMSHPNRFKGNVYCFSHQKTI